VSAVPSNDARIRLLQVMTLTAQERNRQCAALVNVAVAG
jgi:hypothetical protein